MFKVFENKDEVIKVKFAHNALSEPGSSNVLTRYTSCLIALYKDKEKVKDMATGIAYCNPKDNFKKSTGRKLSLARAIKQLGISKEDRKVFWTAYFESIGG